MRLYLTKYGKDGQLRQKWSGTQADARADRKQFTGEGCDDVETEEVDVPTSKAELLEFLNENCAVAPGERQAGAKGQSLSLPVTSPTKTKAKQARRARV